MKVRKKYKCSVLICTFLSYYYSIFYHAALKYSSRIKSISITFDTSLNMLTLPTAKAGGFLLLTLLHWQTPYGTAMSYTVSTSLFPYALRYSFYLYADCICSPFFRILILAFVSRS